MQSFDDKWFDSLPLAGDVVSSWERDVLGLPLELRYATGLKKLIAMELNRAYDAGARSRAGRHQLT